MQVTTKKSVAITDWTFADLKLESTIVEAAGFELVARQCKSEEELIAICCQADAIITQFARISAEVINAMNRAAVIVRYGIGVDNVDLEAARLRGIPVCNIPDYCVDEVADQTLAFILSLTRQVLTNSLHLRSGHWGLACQAESMQALKYLTIGIVGFGRIGREVVKRLNAFKARVLVFDPLVDPADVFAAGAEPVSSFDAMLPQCDVISPHCPSTSTTRGIFSTEAFAMMKPSCLFINVSRGDLVDSQALVAALQRGQLAGAALDVFNPEPIPADSPLRQMPNVILAAHIASVSPVAVRTLRETAARSAVEALRGENPLSNIVNGVSMARAVT